MRRFLAGGLALLLGLWLNKANAQDGPPLATLGRPVAIPSKPSNQVHRATFSDEGITPAGFGAPLISAPRPLLLSGSLQAPQPLPAGPAVDDFPAAEPAPAQGNGLGNNRLVPTPEGIGPPSTPTSTEHTVSSPFDDGNDRGTCADDCCWRSCWGLFRRWDVAQEDTSCLWFRGEYLLWWMKDSHLPPLVTTSPAGTPRELAGVLGAPGTNILFDGGDGLERSGGRFTLGFWFDEDHTLGLESTTFFLGERSLTFRDGSGGVPILARPFFNVLGGAEASELVAFPGLLAGNIAVSSSSQLWSTDLDLRANCWRGCFWHLDLLAGVRFFGLDEHLGIGEGLMVPAGAGALGGSTIAVQDAFGTHNFFAGGQTGLEIGWRRGRWSLDLLGKVALGNTHQGLNINGSTQFAVPGLPLNVQQGGLYALPSNIGHYSRDRFAVMPEAGVIVGFQLTRCVRAVFGYSFIYNSSVLRPGSQIDRAINVTQLPSQIGPGMLVGPARPAALLHGTDFWAQGLSVGLEVRY